MRNVGTTAQVIDAFLQGKELRTRQAPVPGGYRVNSVPDADGTVSLYSYRTVVAVRLASGEVAITPRKYSRTTSKLLGMLRRQLGAATGDVVGVRAAVPGRWGGFGPAWHSTGYEYLPFTIFAR